MGYMSDDWPSAPPRNVSLTYVSLFSGIGGFDLGFDRAGMTCLAQVEWDKKARAVLDYHWRDTQHFKDVRDVGKHNLPTVDLICGGFPCQDVSLAGKQLGLQGGRSTLWTEFARIIREIKPRWVVVENVVGLFSSDSGRFFGNILRDLAESGYDAEWDVLPAAAFGAPHLRPRVFIVAYTRGIVGSDRSVFKGDSNETNAGREVPQKWSSHRVKPTVGLPLVGGTPTYWQTIPEPSFSRMADGLPDELEQIKQYGNAIVPVVAEWIGKRVIELDNLARHDHAVLSGQQFINSQDAVISETVTVGTQDNPVPDTVIAA